MLLDRAVPSFIVDQNSLIDTGAKETLLLAPSATLDFKAFNRTIDNKAQQFHTGQDIIFGSRGALERLSEITGIASLPLLVEEARLIESELFFHRRGNRHFNSKKVGVRSVNFDRRGDDEQARLQLSVYRTDYFTHCVMQRVIKRLIDDKVVNPDVVEGNVSILNDRWYPFMTSLGLNVFLLTDLNRKIVLARRSANVAGDQASRLHVSMNEGFSAIDFDKRRAGVGSITVENCFRRGMDEELGFAEYNKRLGDVSVYDLFLVRANFQVGLFGWASFQGVSEELLTQRGQDSTLEVQRFEFHDFNSESMNDLLSRDVFTSYARFGLWDLCQIRGLITQEFRVRGRSYYRTLSKVMWESILRRVRA